MKLTCSCGAVIETDHDWDDGFFSLALPAFQRIHLVCRTVKRCPDLEAENARTATTESETTP